MKQKIIKFFVLLSLVLSVSCVREQFDTASVSDSYSIRVRKVNQNNIFTKGLFDVNRNNVYDMMLFIFDNDGNIIYYKEYDFGTKNFQEDKVTNNPELVLRGIDVHKGSGRVFALANLKHCPVEQKVAADSVYRLIRQKISEGTFSQTEYESVSIINKSLSRSSENSTTGLIMSGEYVAAHTSEDAPRGACVFGPQRGLLDGEIRLYRIDARVRINIGVDESLRDSYTFTPTSIQLYQVPKYSRLDRLEHDYHVVEPERDLDRRIHDYYFYKPAIIKDFQRSDYAFYSNFYLPENRLSPKERISGQQKYNRDKQKKNSDKTNVFNGEDMRDWQYANNYSTYVKVSGDLQGTLTDNGVERPFSASVSYNLHLGDFDSDMNDYNTKRNTSYNYTIKIRGIDKIVSEVKTDAEDQPSATGIVSIIKPSSNSTYYLDSHHENILIHISLDNDIGFSRLSDNSEILETQLKALVNFNVFTPFNQLYDDQNIARTDYTNTSWIRFSINQKDENGNYNRTLNDFSDKQNTVLMSISDIAYRIRQGVRNLKKGVPDDLFDSEGNLYLTGFINENYYREPDEESDRLFAENAARYENMSFEERMADPAYQDFLAETMGKIPTRLIGSPKLKAPYWKYYANSSPRYFYLMYTGQDSKDKESIIINPSLIIKQRSIQTILTTDRFFDENRTLGQADIPSILIGTGFETIEEVNDIYDTGRDTRNRRGIDIEDGRANTLSIYSDVLNKKWDNYIIPSINGHFNSQNIYYNAIKNRRSYNYPIYECLQRNRDLNRNGIIDEDEIQWYLPAAYQYLSATLANTAFIDPEAVFYSRSDRDGLQRYFTDSTSRRRSRIAPVLFVTSTVGRYNHAWVNEFFSFGGRLPAGPKIIYRCARNLGKPNGEAPKNQLILKHERTQTGADGSEVTLTHKVINSQYLNKSALSSEPREQEFPKYHNIFEPLWSIGNNLMISTRAIELTRTNLKKVNSTGERISVLSSAVFLESDTEFIIEKSNGTSIVLKPGQTPCAILNGIPDEQLITAEGSAPEDVNFAHRAEGGYTNWRVPNAYELGAMFLSNTFQTLTEFYTENGTGIETLSSTPQEYVVPSITVDPERRSFYFYNGDTITRDGRRGTTYVRCVRDIYPYETQYLKNPDPEAN